MKYVLLSLFILSCNILQPPAPAPVDTTQATPVACDIPIKESQPQYEVHFSPHGGCTEMVTRYLGQAKHSIYLQAYSFTSQPIGTALVEQKKAKLTVEVVLDRSDVTEKNTLVPVMLDARIPTYIDKKHAIAHNKVVIIDESIVLTGSFNFTNAAENSNAENCLAIKDKSLAAKYLENWKAHKDHSEKD